MKTKNQILLQKIKDTNPEFKDMDLTPVIYPPGYWDETKSLVKKIFDLELIKYKNKKSKNKMDYKFYGIIMADDYLENYLDNNSNIDINNYDLSNCFLVIS